jgi:hypothetical protein
MRVLVGAGILSGMHEEEAHAADRRASAAANAVLVLALALVPLSGSVDPTSIDHREQRPWGCRTCPIPEPPVVAGVEDPVL